MAVYVKGSIAYQPVVEQINRKFVPRKQVCAATRHAGPVIVETQGWMGGGTRTAKRGGIGDCRKNYLIIRQAGHVISQSENAINARNNFSAVSAGVKFIERDLSQMVSVQTLWVAAYNDTTKHINGISADGYTRRGWIFAVQMAGLVDNDQYNVTHFPTAFDA